MGRLGDPRMFAVFENNLNEAWRAVWLKRGREEREEGEEVREEAGVTPQGWEAIPEARTFASSETGSHCGMRLTSCTF